MSLSMCRQSTPKSGAWFPIIPFSFPWCMTIILFRINAPFGILWLSMSRKMSNALWVETLTMLWETTKELGETSCLNMKIRTWWIHAHCSDLKMLCRRAVVSLGWRRHLEKNRSINGERAWYSHGYMATTEFLSAEVYFDHSPMDTTLFGNIVSIPSH